MTKGYEFLDTLPICNAYVGYGAVGLRGDLGYGDETVVVRGRAYPRALSTHPPARLLFRVEGRFCRFRCHVALNDTALGKQSAADFMVLADGQAVAVAANLAAGDPPRPLAVDISGASRLELVVRTRQWKCCHAVWLNPEVKRSDCGAPPTSTRDCLSRTEIRLPAVRQRANRCVATVASAGYAALLDNMLGSFVANSRCHDALRVVFVVGDDRECQRVASKYDSQIVSCSPVAELGPSVKAVLYSAARVIGADRLLCLDADMVVLGDLRPLFATIDACRNNSILVCREANSPAYRNLAHALNVAYGGNATDLTQLCHEPQSVADYPLVINDGLFAGSRNALMALEDVIRDTPQAAAWVDERRDIGWRNQFIFNLALAQLDCAVELDPIYNLQLHAQDVDVKWTAGVPQVLWRRRETKVVHLSGLDAKQRHCELSSVFSKAADPLVGPAAGQAYDDFLDALRSWIGYHGLKALAWSFYGTSDGESAQVRDSTTMPLFALLHYLIRSNGCVRVLETGTARGVSTACLASAVAHREHARIVTFDVNPKPERLSLWTLLRAEVRMCIEQRVGDSLCGMAAAVRAGEKYDAALLDSLHNWEHVWAEFQLAAQLVCTGGLILIHDAYYEYGAVDEALRRIEQEGYNVVRLWGAEGCVREDDHLGLAIVENYARRRR